MASSDSSIASAQPYRPSAGTAAEQPSSSWRSNSRFPLIPYSIDSWSSFSANFRPENIMIDAPNDSSSRWSGMPPSAAATHTYNPAARSSTGPIDQLFGTLHNPSGKAESDRQWLCIQLDQLALVDTVTFGKTAKQHPCNIKEVEVYYGPDQDHLALGLRTTLRNDAEYESFRLMLPGEGPPLPCRFIKIVPISSHSHNYNSSIWFFAVQGNTEEATVEQAWHEHAAYKERKTLCMMLKHLRQRGLMDEFDALRSKVSGPPYNIHFEHSTISKLHQLLVVEGDFDGAESCMAEAAQAALFGPVLAQAPPHLHWRCIDDGQGPSLTSDENGESPSPRGGHQLVFVPASDSTSAALYLYGGFDGEQELGDFWVFHLSEDGRGGRWHRLPGTQDPGPRSCHKMCLDEQTGLIYLLGRYIDPEVEDQLLSTAPRSYSHPSELANDLWAFHTRGPQQGQWVLLDNDVGSHGGPKLLHDLQMVVDEDSRGIWVFGGRHAHQADGESEQSWSGLYRYNIDRQTWTLLRNDTALSVMSKGELKSRHGHSMMFDPQDRKLIIFGGQRDQSPMTDLWTYSVDTKEPLLVSADTTLEGGPAAAFTQRGVLDTKRRECRFFAGHAQGRRRESAPSSNLFHTFDCSSGLWTTVAPSPNQPAPEARFAHQLVFDPQREIHYIFGGTLTPRDDGTEPVKRLNDLWSLELERISPEELVRKATLLIRRQKFAELCLSQSHVAALSYLKNDLASIIPESDESAHQVYCECMHYLMSVPSAQEQTAKNNKHRLSGKPTVTWEQRTEIFTRLLRLFPQMLQEPQQNLIDLVGT